MAAVGLALLGMTPDDLAGVEATLAAASSLIAGATADAPDGELLRAELRWVCDALTWGSLRAGSGSAGTQCQMLTSCGTATANWPSGTCSCGTIVTGQVALRWWRHRWPARWEGCDMAVITVDGVSKVFDKGVTAVDNVSLEVADGEFMVLVGPSGCGKSTLLRMIAGLESVTHGGVLIDGRDVTYAPSKDRDLAMVFQNYALYPHMTVRKNLGFGLKLRRMPKSDIHAKVTEVATMLGLDELLERKPGQLSGGQRQRVAMGRALVRQPVGFLMDEPLSNLDAKLRVTMRAELSRLHAEVGTTTIYVTHDQIRP